VRAEDTCIIDGDGGGLEIGFNNLYLLEALKAAPADHLTLSMNSASSPCVIQAEDGDDRFLYMVLPVRLRAGE
jgi:DNA polymerase-3 subunit beta